ncbi:hypothetical protein DH2020_040135 [Rehmannia glutinosa]|uniref:Uncharacterized protein n=1 Tax=Rehmannia glutinosa TaxID=99300 RepID=A0ABR0UV39_REHGL
MNWDGLGEEDDEDHFFESRERISSVVPLDLASSGSDDDDDFEDSRMSFVSAISSASIKGIHSIESSAKTGSILGSYDMWMAEPGDIRERRKRLLQGMGLSSTKDMLRLASAKIVGAVSRKIDNGATLKVDDSPSPVVKIDSYSYLKKEEPKKEEPSPPSSSSSSNSHPTAIVLRLTRTSSGIQLGVCQYSSGAAVRISPERSRNNRLSNPSSTDVLQSGAFGSFFLIKNLDTGKEFIVKEYNEQGMWNKLSDVQTGKQLTMEEFEKSVGYSPVVKELMRRENGARNSDDGRKINANSYFTKSFRNSKRKGAAFLKNIKGVATSMSGLSKEQEHSLPPEEQKDQKAPKAATSQWVKARQHGKSYKEFTALHMSQEIQAHEGSIWTIRFSYDARFLASAGEDKVIHIWEVQECEVMSNRPGDDLSSVSGTPVHPMAGIGSDRPPLAEITPMPSEKRKKGKNNRKKGSSIPDYVNVPETVFGLSEKPVCTFKGHQDDVLDLSWSKSQLLLSSSMDKTVRLWDLETRTCLKMFAHNDYVTCIQFNPVDDDYFMSGSLDGKVRIWSIPDRQVADWTDLHEMVTAASYSPMASIDGFRNTSSQISASFSPDGKHVISASEDSQVYIWKVVESKNPGGGKRRSRITVQAHEHFQCKDVSVAIPWPGSTRNEPPTVEIHSKRHSKRSTAPPPYSNNNSPTREDNNNNGRITTAGWHEQMEAFAPSAQKNNGNNNLERNPSIADDDFAHSARIDPGIGVSDSFGSSSGSISYGDSPSISASASSPSQSWSTSWSLFDNVGGHGGQTVQATAWGLVIVTASLEGEIRVYQNFGLPLKVSRQANLFRD